MRVVIILFTITYLCYGKPGDGGSEKKALADHKFTPPHIRPPNWYDDEDNKRYIKGKTRAEHPSILNREMTGVKRKH